MQLSAQKADLSAPVEVAPQQPALVIRWHVSPSAGQSHKIVTACTMVAFTMVCALFIIHSVPIALLVGTAMFCMTAEFLLPVTFTLSSDSATVTCGPIDILEIRRETVRCVYRTAAGLKLSACSQPERSLLEPFRGILLRIPDERSDEVLSFLAATWSLRP